METHCTQEESLVINGFNSVHLSRAKSKKSNKISGGISVFVKSNLKAGVKFLEHKTNDYIWLKLCNTFFSTTEDIYLCFIYNPLSNSSYTQSLDEEIFDLLETDIEKYSKSGSVILAGDLNSRTGTKQPDFIEGGNRNGVNQIFNNFDPDINVPVRFSMDETISSRGKYLNNICIETGLRILNGRTTGDSIGQLTCYTPNGCSVVDYFIVSENLLSKVCFFKVHNLLGDLSDHCQISVLLNIQCKIKGDTCHTQMSLKSYKWNENSTELFQEALSSGGMQQKILNFNKTDYHSDINNMIKDVNTIFYEAANLSLKQKPTKKSTNKLKQNVQKKPNWLDASLSKLKNNLHDKEKLLQKYPFDPAIGSSFFSLLKHNRKTRKKKIRDFRQDLIDKLDNLKDDNPSQYWALLHELSDTNRENSTSDVSTDAWFSYFKNLNEKETNASCDYLKDKLKDMEREKIFTELDNLISKTEIEKAISTLKNKKASGFDSILNEMLKSSQIYLVPCFQKLLNSTLNSGNFPKNWAKGYIVPLFKSGSKDDPSNYRGITIGSCLGKLFVKILNIRLEKFLESRNIIKPEQIGFCKDKRTSDHHLVLRTLIEKYTQQGDKKFFTCFVDLQRAFDTVSHDGLFYKLRNIGVSDLFYNTLKDMYNNIELCVKVDKYSMTENFTSNIGVKQGDNLSPTLFKKL